MTVQTLYRMQVSDWTGVYIYCLRPSSVAIATAWKIRAKGFHVPPVGASVIGSVGPPPPIFFLEMKLSIHMHS